MLSLLPSIQYVINGCYYSINLSKQKQVIIQIEDKKTQKRSTVIITEPMLTQYNITIDDLGQAIYCQSIHEGLNKKYILSHDRDKLHLTFTYPKCKIKSISFQCVWKDIGQPLNKDQRVTRQAQAMIKDIEQVFQKMFERFSKQADAKLAQALRVMQHKYTSLSKDMEDMNQGKINEFQIRCQEIIRRNQRSTQQTLIQQREALIDSNLRYFDEFKLIKADLQTSIINRDLNIRELSQQVSDLRSFVLDHQDKTEDKVDKFAIDLNDLERTVRFSFKQIKDQLDRIQESQPLQERQSITNKHFVQQQVLTNPQVTTVSQRKRDMKQAQEEPTAYLPILSYKELKVSPSVETIFLED